MHTSSLSLSPPSPLRYTRLLSHILSLLSASGKRRGAKSDGGADTRRGKPPKRQTRMRTQPRSETKRPSYEQSEEENTHTHTEELKRSAASPPPSLHKRNDRFRSLALRFSVSLPHCRRRRPNIPRLHDRIGMFCCLTSLSAPPHLLPLLSPLHPAVPVFHHGCSLFFEEGGGGGVARNCFLCLRVCEPVPLFCSPVYPSLQAAQRATSTPWMCVPCSNAKTQEKRRITGDLLACGIE